MHKWIAAKKESKTKSDLYDKILAGLFYKVTKIVSYCFSVMTLESLIIFTVDSTVDMK